jgi:phage protein U
MMFAVLGNIEFKAVGSFTEFETRREYIYAAHKLVQGRPALQWIAADLEEIELEIHFHRSFCIPIRQINAIIAAAEDHQARALVFGNGVHRGYFVIMSIREVIQFTADDGTIISARLRVRLLEYAQASSGAKKPSSPAIGLVPGAAAATYQPGQPPTYSPNSPGSVTSISSLPSNGYAAPNLSAPGVSSISNLPASTTPAAGSLPSSLPSSVIVRAA